MQSRVNGPQPRKAKAAATRKRIIEAATAEFVANGYHGAVMTAIAGRAGVAVQTVYFVFHTKPELFAAALDSAVLGDDDLPPMRQSWAVEASSAPGPIAALQAFIRGSGPILERASALSQVAAAAAATDPELDEVYQSRERLRVEGYRDFVHGLSLPAGTDPGRATDLLLTLHSARVYLALRDERGWSHQDVTNWMVEALPALLVPGHQAVSAAGG